MITGISSAKFQLFMPIGNPRHILTLDPKPRGNVQMPSSQKLHECSLDGPLRTFGFCSDMKFKMAATTGFSLTLDPMGKCSNAFSEITNMVKAKLYMKVHWMVL